MLKFNPINRRIDLELNSWEWHSSLEKKVLTSFTTCHIWKFHVVRVQWRQGNVPESVVHVQNLCFAYQTHCFFDILIAIAVIFAKAPSWGKACSPWALKDFQDQGFFCYALQQEVTRDRTIRSQLIKKKRRWVILLLTLQPEVVSPLQLLMYSGHERLCKLKYC